MGKIELINVYYSPNSNIPEYFDLYFETTVGYLQLNVCSFDPVNPPEISFLSRLEEIDQLRSLYGRLLVNEVRKTYDNNIYILVSDRAVLAIEYQLNSEFDHSIQNIRVIDDITDNKEIQHNDFETLEIIPFP